MRENHTSLIVIIISMLIVSCQQSPTMDSIDDVLTIELNVSDQAETPNLCVLGDTIHMVWTASHADTTKLYYVKRTLNQEVYRTIVSSGMDWFVNWADFSSLAVDPQNPQLIITHWLEKSYQGTYDYDIIFSISQDGGRTWGRPQALHDDGIAAEHGFVSITHYDQDHFFASWLDGRNTKSVDPLNTTKHLPMTIRGGLIHKKSSKITDFEIDNKVCDCCQTSTTQTADGNTIIAYRDRSDAEIRDITVQSYDGASTLPVFKSDDNWKINGCPVNGPAVTSDQKWTAMAWYTAADSAEVKLAYGKGEQFDKTIKIDNGNPLGRVDIELQNGLAYVSWLEMKDQRAEIRLKIIDLVSAKVIDDQLITHTSPERRSGFPIIKISENHLYLIHTEVLSADKTTIRLKQIEL